MMVMEILILQRILDRLIFLQPIRLIPEKDHVVRHKRQFRSTSWIRKINLEVLVNYNLCKEIKFVSKNLSINDTKRGHFSTPNSPTSGLHKSC